MPYTPTANEAEFYHREGYLILPRPIFSPQKYERLKSHMAGIFTAEENQPTVIDCPHWTNPQMFEWLFADEMLDLVEPLIGPDIAVFACHLLQKPAGGGKGVPWHADSVYWRALLDPVEVASVTVALSPASSDNGCLRVIAGSHRQNTGGDDSNYVKVESPEEQVFGYEIQPQHLGEKRAVDIELSPNQASIHDGRLIHGSALNTGTVGRSCLTVRYFPTHVKFSDAAVPTGFHIFLARGKDQAGNVYSDPKETNRTAKPISTA